jgi:hypothetical protein
MQQFAICRDGPGAVTGSNPVNFGVRRPSARRPLLGGVEREQLYLAELGAAPSRRPGSLAEPHITHQTFYWFGELDPLSGTPDRSFGEVQQDLLLSRLTIG